MRDHETMVNLPDDSEAMKLDDELKECQRMREIGVAVFNEQQETIKVMKAEIAELKELLQDKRIVMEMQREEIAELKDINNSYLKGLRERDMEIVSYRDEILKLKLRMQSAANELDSHVDMMRGYEKGIGQGGLDYYIGQFEYIIKRLRGEEE